MIIIRHGEIFTKSDPVRKRFLDRLLYNLHSALPGLNITQRKWRFIIQGTAVQEKAAIKKLQKVFGIASFSVVTECKADMKEIERVVSKIKIKSPFAVRSKRLTKDFSLTSQQINERIGAFVVKKTKAKVNLTKPKTTVRIEIYGKKAYVFTEIVKGPGGLPLGTAGEVTVLLKDANSVKAALMMMKRGAKPNVLGDKKFVKELQDWSAGHTIKVVSEVKGLAVVSGTKNLKEFARLEKKYDVPVYAPLIGL